MREDYFFISNKMTANLEHFINRIDSLEEFERRFPPEFLKDDAHVGKYQCINRCISRLEQDDKEIINFFYEERPHFYPRC